MKTKHILAIFLFLSISYSAEAQFFKKLKKKAQQAAERTILKKTDEVVSKKTEQAIDSATTSKNKNTRNESVKNTETQKGSGLLNMIMSGRNMEQNPNTSTNPMEMMGPPIPAPPDNNVKLPDSYKFSYQVTMQVTSNNNTVKIDYLLQPNETYYAKKQTKNGFTEHIVYDNERSMQVYYAEIQGKKRQARKKMDILTKARLVGAFKDAPDKQVKPLGNKKLLGFNCKGYEITTQEGITRFWVTNEAPATIYGAMFKSKAEIPNSPFTKNSMIMEVDFTSKNTAIKSYQMVCTQLQPKTMAFNQKNYIE